MREIDPCRGNDDTDRNENEKDYSGDDEGNSNIDADSDDDHKEIDRSNGKFSVIASKSVYH